MDCLFKVRTKATRKITPVYGVKHEKFLEFLVYEHARWTYVPAQLFEPISKEEAEW